MDVVIGAIAVASLIALLARRGRHHAQGAGGDARDGRAPARAQPEAQHGDDDDEAWHGDEPVEIPIDGTLDLHTFSPKEVGELVPDYLDACRERGILYVRIIHGKGTGVLRRTVWASLERHPAVEGFELAGHGGGSWGATEVRLRKHPE